MDTLTPDDIEFLRSLANELKTQERGCTATPLFLQVRQKKKVFGIDTAYADDTVLLIGDEYEECYTVGQAKEMLAESFGVPSEKMNGFESLEELEGFCAGRGILATHTGYATHDEFTNCFLTRKGYDQHMQLNEHNYRYGSTPEVFIHHAFRNPELERLLAIVEKFASEEEQQ